MITSSSSKVVGSYSEMAKQKRLLCRQNLKTTKTTVYKPAAASNYNKLGGGRRSSTLKNKDQETIKSCLLSLFSLGCDGIITSAAAADNNTNMYNKHYSTTVSSSSAVSAAACGRIEQGSNNAAVLVQHDDTQQKTMTDTNTTRELRREWLKQRFGDTILRAEQKTVPYTPLKKEILDKKNIEAELKLHAERNREAARVALIKVEETVDVEAKGMTSMKDMAKLIGHTQAYKGCYNKLGRRRHLLNIKNVDKDQVHDQETIKSCLRSLFSVGCDGIISSAAVGNNTNTHYSTIGPDRVCGKIKQGSSNIDQGHQAIAAAVLVQHDDKNTQQKTTTDTITTTRALRCEWLKQRFGDTILRAEQKTRPCTPLKKEILDKNIEAEMKLQVQRNREAARIALMKVEETVEVDDNGTTMRDLAKLIGHTQVYGGCIHHVLGNFGLSLRP